MQWSPQKWTNTRTHAERERERERDSTQIYNTCLPLFFVACAYANQRPIIMCLKYKLFLELSKVCVCVCLCMCVISFFIYTFVSVFGDYINFVLVYAVCPLISRAGTDVRWRDTSFHKKFTLNTRVLECQQNDYYYPPSLSLSRSLSLSVEWSKVKE
jgi:hypothetical protein